MGRSGCGAKCVPKAENLNDDDDASMCVHGNDFMVESRIDVLQDVNAMSEHKVDIEVLAIIGPGQNIKAKIVKRDQMVSRGPYWSSREQQC